MGILDNFSLRVKLHLYRCILLNRFCNRNCIRRGGATIVFNDIRQGTCGRDLLMNEGASRHTVIVCDVTNESR